MTATINAMPEDGIKVPDNANMKPEDKSTPQPQPVAYLLPDVPELLTHLRLIDAIICLRAAIHFQAKAHKMSPEMAWDGFCQGAATKFLEWSQGIDLSMRTIPTPPLDILMIWHSYMLNTKDYIQFQKHTRQGKMSGKSFDWQDLRRKLDLDYDGLPGILETWDSSCKSQTTKSERPLHADQDFDMVAAIQRQLRFAEKVHNAPWRHPNIVNRFLTSAIGRYKEFFALIAENPGVSLAPTLAIDLVWHTHQLSPRRYRAHCRELTGGRFVHHDDTLDEPSLSEAGHNAERLYLAKYGVPYRPAPAPAPAPSSHPSSCSSSDCGSESCRSCRSCRSCSSRCSSDCKSDCAVWCNADVCGSECGTACGYHCGACSTKAEGGVE